MGRPLMTTKVALSSSKLWLLWCCTTDSAKSPGRERHVRSTALVMLKTHLSLSDR
jgi:hypothetical protein